MPGILDELYRPLSLSDLVVSQPEARLYQEKLSLDPLDAMELAYFNDQFPTLLAPPTSVARQIQLQRVAAYITAIRHIKKSLNGVKFTGLRPADGEVGMQPIRPQFTHDAATGTYRANWQQLLAAAAWTDFIGAAAAGAAYTLPDSFGLVITHLTSMITPTPFVSEIQITYGRADLVPIAVRSMGIGDNINGVAVYPIPTVIIPPQGTFFMQIMGDNPGTEDLELGGLVIGLGRVLNETAPAW